MLIDYDSNQLDRRKEKVIIHSIRKDEKSRYRSNDFLHILEKIEYNYNDKKIINQSMVKGEIQ